MTIHRTAFTHLNNGTIMPMQGFGTLLFKDEVTCENYVYEAIREGIRMIDTASAYLNEEAVGRAMQRAIDEKIVNREDIFVIAKLWVQDYPKENVRSAVRQTMKNLQLDYVDLYLLHQPYGKYKEAWSVLEQLVNDGTIRNIGVSNFTIDKLENLMRDARRKPTVNQIEIHPYFMHKKLQQYLKEHDIIPMAWGALFEGQHDIFNNSDIAEIGKKYNKSNAQVILRWQNENGIPALFKTENLNHLKENMEIDDFSLTQEEINTISSYDMGYSEIVDHDNPMTEKWFMEWKIHD